MERNIRTLARWLLTKGVDSSLKIQKLLFFIRYEELKNNKENNLSFFNKNNNFQAWIYGPVNYESYSFLQNCLLELDEKDPYFLSDEEVKEIDKIYGQYFEKWNKFSSSELVEKSHKNKAWIIARGNLGKDEVCRNFLSENEDFLKFNEI